MASSTDDHKSLHKLNPFKLAKAIDSTANGKMVNVTKLSNNFLLLETNSAKQSQAVLDTTSLEDIPVNITLHNSLNFTRGVIKKHLTFKTCLKKTSLQNFTLKESFTANELKSPETQTIQTHTCILTFNRLQLPLVINMGYLRVRVEKYIPSPLRCNKCQKFGHHFSKCRNHTAIYFRSSVPLPPPEVPGMPIKCNNCKNNHPNPKCVSCEEDYPSSSKACPKYKEEQEIISLKYTIHISFPEARKRIQRKPVSYASIATKYTQEIETQTYFPAQPFTFTFTTANTSQSTPTPSQPTSQSTKHCNTVFYFTFSNHPQVKTRRPPCQTGKVFPVVILQHLNLKGNITSKPYLITIIDFTH